MVKEQKVPIWEKQTLNITEASEYFGIGESKLRELLNEHPTSNFVLKNGNKTLVKRKQFEKFIDDLYVL